MKKKSEVKPTTEGRVKQMSYEEIKRIRKELTTFYEKIQSVYSTEEVIRELMYHRGYTDEEMYKTLKEVGVTKVDYISDLTLVVKEVKESQLKEWGLLTSKGEYLLGGRYVIPIRDMEGYISALVGWDELGGARKYVTSPTKGFSKDLMFFNMEHYAELKEDEPVYVVEGIFDTLALRSQNLKALGNMGLGMSVVKQEILKRWGKVVAILDNDRAGSSVNPYKSLKNTKGKWNIKNEVVFVDLPNGIKDVDDLIKYYDCREDLLSCAKKNYLVKLRE